MPVGIPTKTQKMIVEAAEEVVEANNALRKAVEKRDGLIIVAADTLEAVPESISQDASEFALTLDEAQLADALAMAEAMDTADELDEAANANTAE